MAKTKILPLIPEELHEDLFDEVEERKKEIARKKEEEASRLNKQVEESIKNWAETKRKEEERINKSKKQ